MSNIIKLPLFVFCLLLSFNAISFGFRITIYKGVTGRDLGGDYMSRAEAESYAEWRAYDKFFDFLDELRSTNGNERLRGIEGRKKAESVGAAIASFASLQTKDSSGLAVMVMPGANLSPFEPADASTITVDEAESVRVIGSYAPFGDLYDLQEKGKLGPEACRRLREDFIAFKESASDQLERKRRLAFDKHEKFMAEFFTELFNFFLENLQNAQAEYTVITAG